MLNPASTQPLSAPWRGASNAARLHITFDRVASLVVEDPEAPLPRLHARVFEVELVARLVLTSADGNTLEKRTVSGRHGERDLFIRRVTDTAEWATVQHPDISITTTHDPSPVWKDVLVALHDLRDDLDERVSRTPVPSGGVNLDRHVRRAARG